MVVNIQRGWLSPVNKWGCTIALKVNSIANSSSGAPRGGTGARQGSQWENGAGWMLGEGVGGWGWRGVQIECLCAGLIMLWTEWAHITKDLLSVAGELLQSGNSAQPFSLPAARNMWPSSASVGRFKQQQTLCWSHSPSAYKAASVAEGGKSEGRLPLTGSRSAVLHLHLQLLPSRHTALTPGYGEKNRINYNGITLPLYRNLILIMSWHKSNSELVKVRLWCLNEEVTRALTNEELNS